LQPLASRVRMSARGRKFQFAINDSGRWPSVVGGVALGVEQQRRVGKAPIGGAWGRSGPGQARGTRTASGRCWRAEA
jgi:hypothetical protein